MLIIIFMQIMLLNLVHYKYKGDVYCNVKITIMKKIKFAISVISHVCNALDHLLRIVWFVDIHHFQIITKELA